MAKRVCFGLLLVIVTAVGLLGGSGLMRAQQAQSSQTQANPDVYSQLQATTSSPVGNRTNAMSRAELTREGPRCMAPRIFRPIRLNLSDNVHDVHDRHGQESRFQ